MKNLNQLVWKRNQDKAINALISYHRNQYEDRRWRLPCHKSFSQGVSHWTNHYVNDFDMPFQFVCPHNHVITGMSGVHSNPHEDRRYKFRCSLYVGRYQTACEWTGYLNQFDQYLHYVVPSTHFLTGIKSYHVNHYEDRRFAAYICKFVASR
ncbi:hemagglutinin/amebocyte aggregation factor-like [Hydractinia symbiolongicarpus]|uniref:hemagglutinin/amebocyte aggregation factor-like n=1 Tax=Hydractinia symbiolongicarpus TaxID=13093 RepID=UPI00254D9CD0|nr:hemagglutinin/amebocyte aggregation factor-like [Hydractinia symbiolongicarpus]